MVPPRRTLTFADLLILVAASAVAFALIRAYAYVERILRPPWSFTSWQSIIHSASLALWALSIATLGLRFLPPRPPLRPLIHQPGFLVTVAVASNAVSHMINQLCVLLTAPPTRPTNFPMWIHNCLFRIFVPLFMGPALFLALVLWMLGGFTVRRADWVEHLGRCLALIWLLYWLVDLAGVLR